MTRIVMILALASLLVLCHPRAASAESMPIVTDPNLPAPLEKHELVVSALPFGPRINFIEIYNQSDRAVSLDGYSIFLVFGLGDESYETVIELPSGQYLLAKSYIALAERDMGEGFDAYYDLGENNPSQELTEIYLGHPDKGEVLQLSGHKSSAPSRYTWLKRKTGSAGYGNTQDSFTQKESPAELSGRGLFVRPQAAPTVRIIEILSRSSNCAPYDDSLVCGDYIKLHNPTGQIVELSDYVLRSDSGSAKSGNSFSLNFAMSPYQYLSIYLRDDGARLSLNDSGGYIWIEDRGNIAPYTETTTSYPSAGVALVGWSWMYDDNGEWLWTSTPRPNQANLLTTPDPTDSAENGLAPCGEGRYRHPETNRCRNIESTTSTLKPCAPGQERNPATNRCRSIASATSQLQPCAPGQERNPLTNRCRSVVASASTLVPCGLGQERNPATNRCRSVNSNQSTLKPCAPGQERNPATNRCRKLPSSTVLASNDRQADSLPADESAQPVMWYGLTGAVLAVAAGYGVWEWRSELGSAIARLKGLVGKK